MTRCLSAFDSREADDPSSMAPGFYAFPFEDYGRAPVGPFPTYVDAVTAARAEEVHGSDSVLSNRRIAADAFADSLGAKRPTDAVIKNDQRFAQWGDRLARVNRLNAASRILALAEADLYSGHPTVRHPSPASAIPA